MLCPRRLCSEPPLCHHAVLSRDGQCSTPGLCPPCLESGPCPLGRSVRTLGPGGRGGYLHQYLPRSGQLGRLPPFPLLRTGFGQTSLPDGQIPYLPCPCIGLRCPADCEPAGGVPVSYTHLRAHETKANLVCR